MRMGVLYQIKSNYNLAGLLNVYIEKLELTYIVAYPMDSMRKTIIDKNKEVCAVRYYELTALCNGFHNLHDCIVKAIDLLNVFETEYQNDWKHFASVNRVNIINKYGSDEDEDFDDAGNVKFREDDKSLHHYTIKAELLKFFEHQNTVRGEYLESSQTTDYEFYTNMVRLNSEFCISKYFARDKGVELPFYKADKDGEMIPLTTAERMEWEINDDIHNDAIAVMFEAVINDCDKANSLIHTIQPYRQEREKYEQLKALLNKILHLNYH